MTKNNTHVVLIGINRYQDADVGDLRGARNDAIAWWRLCTRYLRVPAEQITVLASPPLKAAELGDGAERSRLTGASREELLDAMRRLQGALQSDDDAVGLLTYSGHGVVSGPERTGEAGEDLALCPQDVKLDGGRLDNLLLFSRIGEVLGTDGARLKVTVVLDTCYTETSADSGPSRGLLGALRERQAGQQLRKELAQSELGKKLLALRSADAMSTRLLLASEHWAPSYEIRIDGSWRGAFSWGLCTLMEQWARRRDGAVTYLNASYRDLMQRTTMLLAAMGVEQTPVIWGPRRVDNLAVLRPGLGYEPGETSPAPDGPRRGKQIPVDGERDITLAWLTLVAEGKTHKMAFVVAAGDTEFSVEGQHYAADMEYWYLNQDALGAVADSTQLTWQCVYEGLADDRAQQQILQQLGQLNVSPTDCQWTDDRIDYSWSDASSTEESESYYFGNDQSGITVKLSGSSLAGLTIYNKLAGSTSAPTTWPMSSAATRAGATITFSSASSSLDYCYHYDL